MYPFFMFNHMIGLVFLIVGIAILVNKKNFSEALLEIVKSHGLLFVYGLFALIVGAMFVVLGQGLIMLIGWIAVIKGALALVFPESAVSLYKKWNTSSMLISTGIVAVLLGLIFLL